MLSAASDSKNRAMRIFAQKPITGFPEITQTQVPSLSSVTISLCIRSCFHSESKYGRDTLLSFSVFWGDQALKSRKLENRRGNTKGLVRVGEWVNDIDASM